MGLLWGDQRNTAAAQEYLFWSVSYFAGPRASLGRSHFLLVFDPFWLLRYAVFKGVWKCAACTHGPKTSVNCSKNTVAIIIAVQMCFSHIELLGKPEHHTLMGETEHLPLLAL